MRVLVLFFESYLLFQSESTKEGMKEEKAEGS
jgi:hypothetical protein